MNKEVECSYKVLEQVYLEGQYASIGLNKMLTQKYKENINTKLVTKLVYGVIEKDISLDYMLKQFLTKLPPKRTMLILKMGVFMHFFLSSLPVYMIVNELVNLAKTTPEKHLAGLINATLKNIFGGKIKLPKKEDGLAQFYSIKYGYPIWLVEELIESIGESEIEKLLSTKLTTDTHVRVVDSDSIDEWLSLLKKYNIRYTQSMDKSCYYVDYFELIKHPNLKKYYIVQGCPSMIVSRNMPPSRNILDVCSAPGGKSVYLAQLQPNATITACDLHEHRLKLVEDFARLWHVQNITTQVMDATKIKNDWVEKFDSVLCDVPCSGVGVVGKKPDILLNRTPDNIEELVAIQGNILNTCANYVKKGGTLIYSTCSILKKENEEVVMRFLSEHKDWVLQKVNTFDIPTQEKEKMVTFYPHISKTEGFFIAKMERV